MGEVLNAEQDEEVMEEFKAQHGALAGEEIEMKGTRNTVDVEEEEEDIEIVESKQNVDFDFLTENMMMTDHLPNYEALDLDLSLEGENYRSMKKGLWYYHHSLKQPTLSYRINRKTKIDNRKHLLIFTSPSGGKSTTKTQIRRIVNEKDHIETSGLSHPEQLIGKVKYKGRAEKKIAVPNLGVLSYKCVVYDEAQDLLNEKNDVYAKAQRIKRIAMDIYGENTISKKLVDDTKEDVLKYDPECRIIDFAHPKKLNTKFFDTGSFRRYDIFNLVYEDEINIDDVTQFKLEEENTKKIDYRQLLKKQYKKPRVDVEFNQQNLDIISYYHKSLLHFLLNHKNQNAFRYALLTRYSLRNVFCKNLLILALSKNEEVPTVETTINACTDTLLFVLKSIESINDLGDMGLSSDLWGGVNEEDSQSLEYLLRKRAITKEESSVSIKKFCTILSNVYGCKNTQSRSHFYRLKRDGFVDSKRTTGESGSKVWLKFIPKEIKINSEEENPVEFWKKHLVTAGHKSTLLTVTNEYFSVDKIMKKVSTAGSVGVWGCMLINLYIRVEVLENKNKNNIYIQYPTSPAVPTVAKKPDISPTITTPKPTVKTPVSRPTVTPVETTPKSQATSTKKNDRSMQFFETKECEHIKPNHTKEEVLKWIKKNPKYNIKQLNDKFGVGCLKFRNELKKEKLI